MNRIEAERAVRLLRAAADRIQAGLDRDERGGIGLEPEHARMSASDAVEAVGVLYPMFSPGGVSMTKAQLGYAVSSWTRRQL